MNNNGTFKDDKDSTIKAMGFRSMSSDLAIWFLLLLPMRRLLLCLVPYGMAPYGMAIIAHFHVTVVEGRKVWLNMGIKHSRLHLFGFDRKFTPQTANLATKFPLKIKSSQRHLKLLMNSKRKHCSSTRGKERHVPWKPDSVHKAVHASW